MIKLTGQLTENTKWTTLNRTIIVKKGALQLDEMKSVMGELSYFWYWNNDYLKIIYRKFGVKNKMEKDHRSYRRNFCSCKKQVFGIVSLFSYRSFCGAPRARFARANVAPNPRKFGKPSIQEILVITWPYASRSVQTLREGVRNQPVGGGVCYA